MAGYCAIGRVEEDEQESCAFRCWTAGGFRSIDDGLTNNNKIISYDTKDSANASGDDAHDDAARSTQNRDTAAGTTIAATAPSKEPVISGMRSSSEVLIYIDVGKALDGGLTFWRSTNGVILSAGDERGIVGTQYFQRVEDRKRGLVLFRDGQIVAEIPGNAKGLPLVKK